MIALNDKVVAYLNENNISFSNGDFAIYTIDGVETITSWNTAILGAQPTQEQLDAAYATWELQQIQAQNKAQATSLLSATDWTSIPDVANSAVSNPYLTNQSAFLAYRSQVRAIAVNPPTTPVTFPTVPTEQWSS